MRAPSEPARARHRPTASAGTTAPSVTRSAARACRIHASESRYRSGTNRPAAAATAANRTASPANRSDIDIRAASVAPAVVLSVSLALAGYSILDLPLGRV